MSKRTPEITLNLHITDWDSRKIQLSAIREHVFIQEQGVPIELEWDVLDHSAHHILAEVTQGDRKFAIGTARIIIKNKQAHIGRMAVLPQWRAQGIGKKILQLCIEECQQQGMLQIVLNAQVCVIPFYQKSGFEISSEQFMDAGIAHKQMMLSLFNITNNKD